MKIILVLTAILLCGCGALDEEYSAPAPVVSSSKLIRIPTSDFDSYFDWKVYIGEFQKSGTAFRPSAIVNMIALNHDEFHKFMDWKGHRQLAEVADNNIAIKALRNAWADGYNAGSTKAIAEFGRLVFAMKDRTISLELATNVYTEILIDQTNSNPYKLSEDRNPK